MMENIHTLNNQLEDLKKKLENDEFSFTEWLDLADKYKSFGRRDKYKEVAKLAVAVEKERRK